MNNCISCQEKDKEIRRLQEELETVKQELRRPKGIETADEKYYEENGEMCK